MSDKEVIINGKKMLYGTGVKGSRETSTNTTATFDGVITQGTKMTAHSLECNRVSYEGATTYMELSETIDNMIDNPGMVTVREVKRPPNEDAFVIVRNYFDCVIDGDDYEIKPEEHTVENLKFKCGRLEKYTEPYTE